MEKETAIHSETFTGIGKEKNEPKEFKIEIFHSRFGFYWKSNGEDMPFRYDTMEEIDIEIMEQKKLWAMSWEEFMSYVSGAKNN